MSIELIPRPEKERAYLDIKPKEDGFFEIKLRVGNKEFKGKASYHDILSIIYQLLEALKELYVTRTTTLLADYIKMQKKMEH